MENIDTTSPTRKLVFYIFRPLAEFERWLIREWVKDGLDAAKINIARHFNVPRQTIYTLFKEFGAY